MSDFSDSLIELGCTPQSNCCSGLFTMEIASISDSWQSAITVDLYARTTLQILNKKPRFTYIVHSPLWQLIYVVNSPLRQFDQRSLARFNQTVSKIGHLLKTFFFNLKGQGPLKNAKNIAGM